MRTKSILAAALVAATALTLVGAASAGRHHQHHFLARGIRYSFVGKLTALPASGGVSVVVAGGDRPALRAMLGAPVTQTFAYGASTEFLQWSKGLPAVVQPS